MTLACHITLPVLTELETLLRVNPGEPKRNIPGMHRYHRLVASWVLLGSSCNLLDAAGSRKGAPADGGGAVAVDARPEADALGRAADGSPGTSPPQVSMSLNDGPGPSCVTVLGSEEVVCWGADFQPDGFAKFLPPTRYVLGGTARQVAVSSWRAYWLNDNGELIDLPVRGSVLDSSLDFAPPREAVRSVAVRWDDVACFLMEDGSLTCSTPLFNTLYGDWLIGVGWTDETGECNPRFTSIGHDLPVAIPPVNLMAFGTGGWARTEANVLYRWRTITEKGPDQWCARPEVDDSIDRPDQIAEISVAIESGPPDYFCVRYTDGTANCGRGGPDVTGPAFPQLAGFPRIDRIVPNENGGCLLSDGEVYCWGTGAENGFSAGTPRTAVPSLVVGLPPITDVATKKASSCAVSTEGEIYCWGNNMCNLLGEVSSEAEFAIANCPSARSTGEAIKIDEWLAGIADRATPRRIEGIDLW